MRLILIRHAETEGNRNRFVGREDLPLNETGRRQSRCLARTLAGVKIDAVFVSPLQRAIATAQPFASERQLELQIRDALIEIDFGNLQGTSKGQQPFKLRREHAHVAMPGGESLRDVWGRLASICEELSGFVRAGAVPAVVGHYWSNRLLMARLSGVPFDAALEKDRYKPKNASAYALDFAQREDGLRLVQTTKLAGASGTGN